MLEYTQNLSSDVLPDGSEWDFVVEDAHEKEIASDDRMRDYREAFDAIAEIFRLGNDEGPAIGIVAHTRKPIASERANARTPFNLLTGSCVLSNMSRCVFIMQNASDDVNDTRVVFSCCKNNDERLGPHSDWERHNGLFAPAKDFDWDEFDHLPDEFFSVETGA